VQKKAADYIRERTEAALKLRERDVAPAPAGASVLGGQPVGPAVGTPFLFELPPFAQPRPPLPEDLPGPRPQEKQSQGPSGTAGSTPVPREETTPEAARPARPEGPFASPVPGAVAQPQPNGHVPASPATLPQDYFRPSGRVILPRRERRPVAPAPGVTPSCPRPEEGERPHRSMPPLSLPVPPADTTLPTPPPDYAREAPIPSLPTLPTLNPTPSPSPPPQP